MGEEIGGNNTHNVQDTQKKREWEIIKKSFRKFFSFFCGVKKIVEKGFPKGNFSGGREKKFNEKGVKNLRAMNFSFL